jgi:hypothetical protein
MNLTIFKQVPRLIGALLLYSAVYKLMTPGQATYALLAVGFNPMMAKLSIVLVTSLRNIFGGFACSACGPPLCALLSSGNFSLFYNIPLVSKHFSTPSRVWMPRPDWSLQHNEACGIRRAYP